MSRADWRPLEKQCDNLWKEIIHRLFAEHCGLCKSTRMLSPHHIIKRRYKLHRHAILNGILLCIDCHNAVHKLKKHEYTYLMSASPLNKIDFDFSAHYMYASKADLSYQHINLAEHYTSVKEDLKGVVLG